MKGMEGSEASLAPLGSVLGFVFILPASQWDETQAHFPGYKGRMAESRQCLCLCTCVVWVWVCVSHTLLCAGCQGPTKQAELHQGWGSAHPPGRS